MKKVEFVFKDYQKVLSEQKSEIDSIGRYIYFGEFCRYFVYTSPFYVTFSEFNLSFKEMFTEGNEHYEEEDDNFQEYYLFYQTDPLNDDEFRGFDYCYSFEDLVELIIKVSQTTKETVLNTKVVLTIEDN